MQVLAPCLLVLTFAMLPLFCDQAFSLSGVDYIQFINLSKTIENIRMKLYMFIGIQNYTIASLVIQVWILSTQLQIYSQLECLV